MWSMKGKNDHRNTPAPSKPEKKVDYLAELNREQRRAVEYGITGKHADSTRPLLVLAGAGTGKTKTLVYRVAHLLANGVPPHRILLLTFTCRAANEMIQRVEQVTSTVVGRHKVELPWAGTFHAVGLKLLKRYAKSIQLNPSFTIIDSSDAADLMNLERHELKLSNKKSRFPLKDECLGIYSRVINSGAPLEEVLAEHFSECSEWKTELRKLFRNYVAAKRRQNLLDYDDLLLYWSKMLDDKQIAAAINRRFHHVLVDEFQDTNWLQAEILRKLKPDGRGVAVVGDDAQAIYSFRAATVRNILDFPKLFKRPARIIKLEQNYRSTQPILRGSNQVMEYSKERYVKQLWSDRRSKQKPFLTRVLDEAAQAKFVAQEILAAREEGVPLREQAVLFRASSHGRPLEIELGKRKIPYRTQGGPKFVETAHIKDVLSILRWCENPRNRVAGLRMLQLLPGIGWKTAAQILDQVEDEPRLSNALAQITVPKLTAVDWPKFVRMIRRVRKAKKEWAVEIPLVRKWYEPHLRRLYKNVHIRLPDLDQLQNIAAGYDSRDVFLADLALDPPKSADRGGNGSDPDEDCTILSTIHSAKGQEWQIVRILNVVDGGIPSSKAGPEDIEEELRLLHVAMTRAKDQLDLLVPQQYRVNRGADWVSTLREASRFVPESIHGAFECRTWHERRKGWAKGKQLRSSTNVSAAVSQMWE